MIAYVVYNALKILYCTPLEGDAKATCMFFSGIELFMEIGGFLSFSVIYLPDVLRKWRKQKRRNRK